MNTQEGPAGAGGFLQGVGGGVVNIALLQSFEQMMSRGEGDHGMGAHTIMSGVQKQLIAGRGSTVEGGVGVTRAAAAPASGGSELATGGSSGGAASGPPSRYVSQKRRDWNTFGQYLKNHRPPLALSRCSGAHVLEFLKYLDQFGKTKVHAGGCPFFGNPQPPAPCACPLRQAWGSLDALIGRLRAAYEEHDGKPESNPFGARAVRLYLRDVREMQAKARGIAYEKKKRKHRPPPPPPPSNATAATSSLAISPQSDHHHHNQYDSSQPFPPLPSSADSSPHHNSFVSGSSSSLLIPSFH